MIVRGKAQPMRSRSATRQFLLLFLFYLVSYAGFSQSITLSLKKVSLEKAFKEIESKVAQRFVYTSEMLAQSRPVTLSVTNAPLQGTLDLLFESQPLAFSLDERFIKVRFKAVAATPPGIEVHGKVTDNSGQPLPGVSISAKASGLSAATNAEGVFVLQNVPKNEVLTLTSIGFAEKRVPVNNRGTITVQMDVAYNSLDETVVMAYGTTTRRLNTGSIVRVTADVISRQPVSNPIGALYGRVPGLVITQSNGLPGSKFNLELRGRNSIVQGSDPLIIIDGIPLASGNNPINLIASAVGSGGASGMSALNTINPLDIESIEVLKDADATAIYGSRGANGVILISTKKGKAGETRCTANFYSGGSRITRTMNMLNTVQYVQMRWEALANEGLDADISLAPDLVAWDTTRFSDFKKLLIGNTAHTNDAQVNISGGTATTRFLLGAGYHQESTVFPGHFGEQKITFHSNITHTSPGKKFYTALSLNYGSDKSNLIGTDLTAYINLPPNLLLYDSANALTWKENDISFGLLGLTNPLASLLAAYNGQFDNLLGNLQIGYKLLPGLNFKVSLGYNSITGDELSVNPSTSIDPARGLLPYSSFANSIQKSWIMEPQAEYTGQIGKGKLNLLIGSTWQEMLSKGTSAYANDYTSDLLLGSISAAGNITALNTYNQYRYNAGFGRLTYTLADKYVVNISGRRDGSSRFGPNNQFANFGAAGAAWIFSKEAFLRDRHSFLSFGKIRGSYGTTGNDQIGDYKFLETWTNTPLPYQGTPGLRPTSLYNPDYSWEINRKVEAGIELGFLQDKIFLSGAFFKNRCSNQLVNYTLPIQTGFPSVTQNIDAVLQNSGMEIQASSRIGLGNDLNWVSSFTLSLTRNKLVSFPNLERTTYAQNYVIGQPLSTRKSYQYLGVDAATGVYLFNDVNHDNGYDLEDRVMYINTDPKFYGGFTNTFAFRNIELQFLLEFRKQRGLNYLYTQSQYIPGYYYFNQPAVVLERWQKAGDVKPIQKFVATGASDAFIPASEYLAQSEAVYGDASFIRLKNVSLSYELAAGLLKKARLSAVSLYLNAQNLFTLTRYTGADPENQNLYVLPPLKTITAGIRLHF